jgi:hypothetical protein
MKSPVRRWSTQAILATVPFLLILGLLPLPALAQARPADAWPIVSHRAEWREFLEAAPAGGRWAAFESSYYAPNRALLDELLRTVGIEEPERFLRRQVSALDLEAAQAAAGRRSVALEETVRAAIAESLARLPVAARYEGEIQLLHLFGMFDGMALVLRGVPTVILDHAGLAGTEPRYLRILVAHEFNHAVRWAALGDPVPPGGTFLDMKAGESMVAEGLAVAFSRLVFPGLPSENYIPYYRINPGRLAAVAARADGVRAEILLHRDAAIGSHPVRRYFYGTGPDDPGSRYRNAAYLVGDQLIRSLLRSGASIDSLTVMPTEAVLERAR